MTTIRSWIGASLGLIFSFFAVSAAAIDFVVPTAGHVTIEYVSADSAFINTLSVTVPAPQSVSVAFNGCKQVPAPGLGGLQLLSSTVSRARCRVELDSDPLTPGIQGFAAGTVLRFQICPQAPGESNCRNVWSSNPAQNTDLSEHVLTSSTGNTTLLRWEDLPRTPGSSDDDFNDLIVAVHVNGDADGDGIWDDWEQQQQQLGGIDLDGDGIPDLVLPGANPLHKDLYVRIDYMDCNVAGSDCVPGDTHSHRPLDAAIQEVINAFASAPALKPDGTLLNPDGLPGINVHIEIGNAVVHQTYLNIPDLCFSNLPGVDNFDTVKARNFPQTDPRAVFYHYGLFSHQQAVGATSSGCAEMPGNDFQVSLGGWNIGAGDIDGDGIADDGVGSISQQAGTLMHELGHNLGLRHGGTDDTNYKPNYLSIMNYSFQMDGIPTNDAIANPFVYGRIDYSRRALAPLDELNLQELPGLGAGNDNTLIFCPDTFPAIQPGSGFIDWNCNGRRDCSINPVTRVPVCTPIAFDVNLDGICVSAGRNGRLNSLPALDDRTLFGFYITEGANRTCDTVAVPDDEQISPPGKTHPRILTSFSDWPNLKYDFQNTRNFEDGTHIADADQTEISYELYLQRTAADLVVSQTASPATVVAGSNVTYQVDLTNRGLPPARNVVVKDVLPAAATVVSCSVTNGGTCNANANEVTVNLPVLRGGATASVTLVAATSCAMLDGTALTNAASATTTVRERTTDNNSAAATATVINLPPVVGPMTATPAVLWPPKGKLIDVAVNYEVSGSCGPMQCALDLASNPPFTEDGDDDDDDDDDDCRKRDQQDHSKHCEHHKTKPNWIIIDAHHVQLRARKAKHHKDRLYTITATCSNSVGAATTNSAVVKVPHKKPK